MALIFGAWHVLCNLADFKYKISSPKSYNYTWLVLSHIDMALYLFTTIKLDATCPTVIGWCSTLNQARRPLWFASVVCKKSNKL